MIKKVLATGAVAASILGLGATQAMAIGDAGGTTSVNGNGASQSFGNAETHGDGSPQFGLPNRANASWFANWRDRRRQRISQQREREENAEQQLIDDLLAKVGSTGLASLSKQERAILESYSRKQRERQLIGRD